MTKKTNTNTTVKNINIPKDIINIRPKNKDYVLYEDMAKAIEVAMKFDQPILLTGEPGTGKTLLASKLASMLAEQTENAPPGSVKFADKPLRFNTKTTSAARDLFYTYDAVGHFQEANIRKESGEMHKSVKDFLELQAMGKAIVCANPAGRYDEFFTTKTDTKHNLSHVVLIDEIDKAPRDFTNDLLNEIENYVFEVKELNNEKVEIKEDNAQRIVVVMTSNSEKNLPEAFLRRCVFFHIEFPTGSRMTKILKAQLTDKDSEIQNENLIRIEQLFQKLRKEAIRKKPATAELVALVKLLESDGLLKKDGIKDTDFFTDNLALIAKTTEDLSAFEKFLKKHSEEN